MDRLISETKFRSWLPLSRSWHNQFSADELRLLRNGMYRFDRSHMQTVYLTFENRLASHGGLGAVARFLPQALHDAGRPPVTVTPYHRNNPQVKLARTKGELSPVFRNLKIRLAHETVMVTVYRDLTLAWPSFHLSIPDHFTGAPSPYDISGPQALLEDCCLFCTLLPPVLRQLGYRANLMIHANDWETAPVAFSIPLALFDGTFWSARTVLTLHNSFDCGIDHDTFMRFWGRSFDGRTVLEAAIPLITGPLTTVSAPFAAELRHDPLQRALFAPHLQQAFSINPPVGVENGPFGTIATHAPAAVLKPGDHDPDAILRNKRKLRASCDRLVAQRSSGGSPTGHLAPGTYIPLFFMSGRLDLAQKGFDVLFEAFMALEPGRAQLLFSPTPSGTDSEEAMEYFVGCTQKHAGRIAMLPERIPEAQYHTILGGASFLAMPSFYEPFGAATEGFLHGTPVVARATGGLISQIVPLTKPPLPAWLARFCPPAGDGATGILFRENKAGPETQEQWLQLLALGPGERHTVPLFRAMVQAAKSALEQACDLFANEHAYAQMVAAGFASSHRRTWVTTVEALTRVYDTAARYRIN